MAEAVFLLDSNICIYVLADAECDASRTLQQMRPGMVAVSAIAHAEVMRGIPASEPRARRAADRLFQLVPVLPFEQRAARAYAELPFRRGRFDHLIAAHALALDITLVTNNEADFADMPGLKIENWTVAP